MKNKKYEQLFVEQHNSIKEKQLLINKVDCVVDLFGKKYYYKKGTNILHREDGPAVECANGDKYWYINGRLHREDGPALEYSNGDKEELL